MTIEIYSPNLKVSQKIIDKIEKKLLELSHLGEKISRAEVFLSENKVLPKQNKICKIRLDIFGDTFFVQRKSDSFENAAATAIRVLKRSLKKKQAQRNLPPEEITSTIKI